MFQYQVDYYLYDADLESCGDRLHIPNPEVLYEGQDIFDTEDEDKPLDCPYFKELQVKSNFEVRYRKEGQRVKLKGKKHSSSLKKILQESSIPPWQRDKLRMYYIDGNLKAMELIGEMSEVLNK